MDLKELLSLAQFIVSDDFNDSLELIENYSSSLSNLLSSISSNSFDYSSDDLFLLRQIFSCNELILTKISSLLSDSSSNLKKFKERSKAIRAYSGLYSENLRFNKKRLL